MTVADAFDVPTAVLVHGAFHGPWVWTPLIGHLTRRGIRSVPVTLPSSAGGDVPGTFLDDVDEVTTAIQRAPQPVMLVAHSYGGAVATHVAELTARHAVAGVVYVAAMIPPDRQPLAHMLQRDDIGRMPQHLSTTDDGRMSITAAGARDVFYDDIAMPNVTTATGGRRPVALIADPWQYAALLTPMWTIAMMGQVTPNRRMDLHRRAIIPTDDRALPAHIQRDHATRAGIPDVDIVDIPGGHSPMLTRPATIADVVTAVAVDIIGDHAHADAMRTEGP